MDRRISWWWLLSLPVVVVAVVIARGDLEASRYGLHRIAEAQSSLRSMQLSLDRYAVEQGGMYPATLERLVTTQIIDTLPDSVYKWSSDPPRANSTIQPITPGGHSPGDYTYLPHLSADGQRVTGYALLVYGDDQARSELRWHDGVKPFPLPGGAEQRVRWDYVLQARTGGDWPGPNHADN